MRVRRFVTICISVVLLASPALADVGQASVQHVTVEGIERDLASLGGKAVLERYFDCSSNRNAGYALVSQGSTEAVALAMKVLQYSDACITKSLSSSLSTAMARNPKAVLPYVPLPDLTTGSLIDADHLCLPSIGTDVSNKRAIAIALRSKRAVENVHTPSLQPARGQCLVIINAFVRSVQHPKYNRVAR